MAGAQTVSATDGCSGRDCPCRMWINCPKHKDIKAEEWIAEHGDAFNDLIHGWYDTAFKLTFEARDGCANG